jgi:hypothetical protein
MLKNASAMDVWLAVGRRVDQAVGTLHGLLDEAHVISEPLPDDPPFSRGRPHPLDCATVGAARDLADLVHVREVLRPILMELSREAM